MPKKKILSSDSESSDGETPLPVVKRQRRSSTLESDAEAPATPTPRSGRIGQVGPDGNLIRAGTSSQGASQMVQFREGSLVRVAMHNFMTYDDVEFFPGPRLNLVLGPNGTGKSTIVNAICLGLCGQTKLLGRASNVRDYIKRGSAESGWVELELAGREGKPNTVLRRLIKNDNTSHWTMNKKTVTQDQVKEFVHKMNIQLDNLTQFLPQDKVVQFASMTPQQVLQSTQDAVLPPESVDCHKKLIEYKKGFNDRKTRVESGRKALEDLKKKNEILERDVVRMQERQKYLDQIAKLSMRIPYVEFQNIREELKTLKEKETEEMRVLKEALAKIEPLKQKRHEISKKEKEMRTKCAEDLNRLKDTERRMKEMSQAIERYEEQVRNGHRELESLEKNKKEREAKKRKMEDDLAKKRRELSQLRPQDDITSDIDRVMADIRTLEAENEALENTKSIEMDNMRRYERDLDTARHRLAEVEGVMQRRLQTLRHIDPDACFVWDYVQSRKDAMHGQVWFVPLEINVAPAYAAMVEAHIGKANMHAILCEDGRDRDHLVRFAETTRSPTGRSKVHVMIVKKSNTPEGHYKHSFPADQFSHLGMTHWLDQTFEAPPEIKMYLKDVTYIHTVGVCNERVNDKEDKFFETSGITAFFTKTHSWRSRPSKFDPRERSTNIMAIRQAKLLGAHDPAEVDSRKAEVARLETIVAQQRALIDSIQKKHTETRGRQNPLTTIKARLIEERKLFPGLNGKIARLETDLKSLSEEEDATGQEKKIKDKMRKLNVDRAKKSVQLCDEYVKFTSAILENDLMVLELQQVEEQLRDADAETNAMLREVEGFKARVEQIKKRIVAMTAEGHRKSEDFKRQREEYLTKNADVNNEALMSALAELPEGVPELQEMVMTAQSQAESIHHDPTVIRQYEERKREIVAKEAELAELEDALNRTDETIQNLLSRWLPPLKETVAKINETFQQFCKNIGILGEVELQPSENFEHYAIGIKVKFRGTEDLQTLNAHRQSGGERSVTTILYLLALQQLNKCPFRVVDEINQGMDPVNERKIFMQMVESSRVDPSAPNTVPQCFLVTPKLLDNLVPVSRDIAVLLVHNGLWNVDQKTWFRVQSQIDSQAVNSESQPLSP